VTVDRTTTGDTNAEVAEEPAAPERRTPADDPGADGVPSRADSRAGAAAANDTASSQTGKKPGEDKPETAPQDEGSATEQEPAGSADAVVEANEVSDTATTPDIQSAEAEPGEATDVDERDQAAGEQAAAPESAAAVGTGTDDSAPSVKDARKDGSEFPDEEVGKEKLEDVPEPVKQARPEANESGARADVTDGGAADNRPAGVWGSHDTGPSTEAAFWTSTDQSTDSPSTAEVTSHLDDRDRPDAAADRPVYPEVTDRSDYAFTDREYAFAGVSPQQAWDMHERRTPLGTEPEQWATCVGELHEALAAEGITDADVRLKGSAARFCSENPKKWFPQTEDELRAKVTDHYRNAPQEERTQRADNAAATYREAGFAEDGGKPAAPFFDSMYKLDATNELSDYDFQVASDGLAERFQQFEKADPKTGWRSEHGGHYKHRHLERVAPSLHDWAGRWEGILGRDVTIATFDHRGPSTGLHDSDWKVIEPEEQTDR
jgi:hypothetical protein